MYKITIKTIVQAAIGITTIKYMNKKTFERLSNWTLSSLYIINNCLEVGAAYITITIKQTSLLIIPSL